MGWRGFWSLYPVFCLSCFRLYARGEGMALSLRGESGEGGGGGLAPTLRG